MSRIKQTGVRRVTAQDLRGLTPNVTGGLSSDEYVRRIRDEAAETTTISRRALTDLCERAGLVLNWNDGEPLITLPPTSRNP